MAVINLRYTSKNPIRLDLYLSQKYPVFSRSVISRQIESGAVKVNAETAKPATTLKPGDSIMFSSDLITLKKPPKIDLDVLFENDFCIVINKPSGIITHAKGRLATEPSIASFIDNMIDKDFNSNRGGIVHRLDRGTSGVIITAKTLPAQKYLQRQFARHQAKKTYLAIVPGGLSPEEAQINMPIERNPKKPSTFRPGPNGKFALTSYKIAAQNPQYTLLSLAPTTGRTHQLRVHLKAIGFPIVGDDIYGGQPAERLMLHAASLSVILPDLGRVEFKSPIPREFARFVKLPSEDTND